MLHFHRTSILSSSAQTVVNTVNTVGVMGKGLAASFKKKYPEMFLEYKEICQNSNFQPGTSRLWKGPEQWVLNFATKKHWRNPSKIEYIRNGLEEFRSAYEFEGIREIAFPRLGCGNGGLDWNQVRPLMIEYLRDLPITIYIHDFEKSLGRLEHELPLLKQPSRPITFGDFIKDLKETINRRNGEIQPVMMKVPFYVLLNDASELYCATDCSQLIAAEEDLFRIWTMLSAGPITRYDLPENIQSNALKLLSVISQLPYVRPINIATRHGRNILAVEQIRNLEPARIAKSA